MKRWVWLIGLCLVLSGTTAALAEDFQFAGGSLTTTNQNAWGGVSRTTYGAKFDFSAGPTEVEIVGLDLTDILYEGEWPWPPLAESLGAQARFGITGDGFWSIHSLHSAIGNGGGSWDQQGATWDHDDGFRKYLIQNQYSGWTVGTTKGNHQYNVEALIPRTGGGASNNDNTAVTDRAYNTFDMKILYTPTGTPGEYVVQGWVRLYKAASTTEMATRPGDPAWGSSYTWVWNKAIDNQASAEAAWVPFYDGTWIVTGDLSAAQPFVEIMNWGVPQTNYHTFQWACLQVTGTPAAVSTVWVDDDWAGLGNGVEVSGHYVGYDAFATIQDGVDRVSGSTVNVAAGTYTGATIDKDVTVQGDPAGGSVLNDGVPYKTGGVYKTGFLLEAGADGATIKDFIIVNDAAQEFYFAVFSRCIDDVTVEELTVYDTVQGISNWGGSGWSILDNDIIGTVASGGGGIGIFIGAMSGGYETAANNLIQGNVIGSDATAPDYSCPGIAIMLDLRWDRYDPSATYDLGGNQIIGNYIADGGVDNGVGIEVGVNPLWSTTMPLADILAATLGCIHDTTIAENTVIGEDTGIYLYNVVGTDVLKNIVSGCTSHGIGMWDGSIDNVFRYNSITGNAAGLYNETGALVDAALNWWGDGDGPSGEGTGGGDSVSANVIFSPWLGIDPDGDPATVGVQLVSPMLFIVDDVGYAPALGYLGAAIDASNTLGGTDTIEVRHGAYDASEPITEAVNIVSEIGSAAHTTLDGAISIDAANVLLGRLRQGFTITGPITIGAGVDASTIHINWNDIFGVVTNEGENTLDATFNFWGEDGPDTIGLIAIYPILPESSDTVIGYMDGYDLTALEAVSFSGLLLHGMMPGQALLALNLGATFGFDGDEFDDLVDAYGQAAVDHALAMSNGDYETFVTLLMGYGEGGGGGGSYLGGGGGGTIGATGLPAFAAGEVAQFVLDLVDPITGEITDDAVVSVTVCRTGADGAPELFAFAVMTFDGELGAYVFEYDTTGLEPGVYDVYLGSNDGRSRHFQIEITE